MNLKNNLALSIESIINNNAGIDCEAIAIYDYITFNIILELNAPVNEKQVKNAINKLSYALNEDYISLKKKGNKLYFSIPKDNNKIIHFNLLHNQEQKLIKSGYVKENNLVIPVGINEAGQLVYLNFNYNENREHLAIIGSSQNGKSASLDYIITSLLLKNMRSKNQINFVLVDCIKKKFRKYKDISNIRVASTIQEANACLDYIQEEIDIRYKLEAFKSGLIVLVIEEFQQFVELDKTFSDKVQSIIATSLEANIYVIIASQKLSVSTSKNAKNIINNILSRIYFRTENKRNSKMLYDLDTSSLKEAGQCFINKERCQFGFMPVDAQKEILNSIVKKQSYKQVQEIKTVETNNVPNEKEEHTQPISKSNLMNFEEIKNKVPNEIITFLLDCKNGLVSANKLRKYLNVGMDKATNYCNELEALKIIYKLDNNRGRIITDLGKEFLSYCMQENTTKDKPVNTKVIPLFNLD